MAARSAPFAAPSPLKVFQPVASAAGAQQPSERPCTLVMYRIQVQVSASTCVFCWGLRARHSLPSPVRPQGAQRVGARCRRARWSREMVQRPLSVLCAGAGFRTGFDPPTGQPVTSCAHCGCRAYVVLDLVTALPSMRKLDILAALERRVPESCAACRSLLAGAARVTPG